MKKILFIDRDGTILQEPADEQIDSLEKLVFVPYAISAMKAAMDLGYDLVMVTNQDGLGTESFPVADFQPVQDKLLSILNGEGVYFEEVFIDHHFAHENHPNRKPGTGLLGPYLTSNRIDLAGSYTIGDRKTDVELAWNLGCQAIWLLQPGLDPQRFREDSAGLAGISGPSGLAGLAGLSGPSGLAGPSDLAGFSGPSQLAGPSGISGSEGFAPAPNTNEQSFIKASGWVEVLEILKSAATSGLAIEANPTAARKVNLSRKTTETNIELSLNLDGHGQYQIDTGLRFYDHMLEQLSRHSGIDLMIYVSGDLDIDEHHTIEDSAIALGQAFRQAMGSKSGMERYGFLLPMDEALVRCALDFSGRAYFLFKGSFDREYVGDFPTEMLEHWMKSFSEHAGLNLHLEILEGTNTHHKVEASFKALARCLKQALAVRGSQLGSTKGIL